MSCNVTLPSTLANFEQEWMELTVMATASARGAGTTVTGESKSVFTLTKLYKVSVEGIAVPATASSAGRCGWLILSISMAIVRQQKQRQVCSILVAAPLL